MDENKTPAAALRETCNALAREHALIKSLECERETYLRYRRANSEYPRMTRKAKKETYDAYMGFLLSSERKLRDIRARVAGC